MEIWDAYDENGKLTGEKLIRMEPIPAGRYHLVVSVIVRHRTDGTFLLMKRDPNKFSFPGVYEISAGGSALRGEDGETAIRRELEEETGITQGDFYPLYRERGRNTFYHGFLCITDAPKYSIRLQEGETVDYRWFSMEKIRKTLKENPRSIILQRPALFYYERCDRELWPIFS